MTSKTSLIGRTHW